MNVYMYGSGCIKGGHEGTYAPPVSVSSLPLPTPLWIRGKNAKISLFYYYYFLFWPPQKCILHPDCPLKKKKKLSHNVTQTSMIWGCNKCKWWSNSHCKDKNVSWSALKLHLRINQEYLWNVQEWGNVNYGDLNRRQIDITTYQIRKIKADTSLCLFANEMYYLGDRHSFFKEQ